MSFARLPGGVSSDIWRVDTDVGTWCLKCARRQLNVIGNWTASVERTVAEATWLNHSAGALQVAEEARYGVPQVLSFHKEPPSYLLLSYYGEHEWSNLRAELFRGAVDRGTFAALGQLLARCHGASASMTPALDPISDFHALRVDPFFDVTARANPDLASEITSVADSVLSHRSVAIHGDVSPKNVLVHRSNRTPLLLDAECAAVADVAFDLAFMLSHLLIKAVHVPQHVSGLLEAATVFIESYQSTYQPERPDNTKALNERTAMYVPALVLARVDGQSPATYLSAQSRHRLRSLSRVLLHDPPSSTGGLIERWQHSDD